MEIQNNRAIEIEIKRRIAEKGKITFAEFMDLALYHPLHGYYCTPRSKIGPGGDFLTSPETHPAFGAMIALQLEQMWRLLDRPGCFTVVEMGGGTGALCRTILEYSRKTLPEFHEALEYVLVDRHDVVGEDSQGKVRHILASGVESPLQGIVGCFLSNELVDAFPVHKVAMEGGRLREVFVGGSEDGFGEVVDDLSTSELAGYFEALGLSLGEGYRVEVNLEGLRWMESVAGSLERGFVLTVDYGFPTEELYSEPRRGGTLMCYYHHTYGHNPYVRVGRQDLTTHVDFTSLIRAGARRGLRFTGMVYQADFLSNLGLDGFVAAMSNAGLAPAVFYNNKFAVRRLAEAQGLGKFKVLVQHKGVVEPSLDCFNPCNDRKRTLIARGTMPYVPLLAGGAKA